MLDFIFNAIFSDLGFTHPTVRLELAHLSTGSYKLVLLGFLEGYDGPDDIFEYFKSNADYQLTQKDFTLEYVELGQTLKYSLCVFEPFK